MVKLSNGTITIVEELVYGYERAPSHISKDRFETASYKFISNNPIKASKLQQEVVQNETPNSNTRNFILALILVVIIIVIALFVLKK